MAMHGILGAHVLATPETWVREMGPLQVPWTLTGGPGGPPRPEGPIAFEGAQLGAQRLHRVPDLGLEARPGNAPGGRAFWSHGLTWGHLEDG